MKNTNRLLLSLAAPLLGAAELNITPYFEGRQAALSLTFDDGFRQEVDDALAILDPLEIRGTFFLIPLRMTPKNHPPHVVTWERVLEMQERGHEIGTHGAVNEKLHEVTADRLNVLVNESWRILKERTGTAPKSYARPGGSKIGERETGVILQNHRYIRGQTPLPVKTRTIGYGNAGRRKWEDEATRQRIENSISEGEWVVPVVHSIVGGYSPFKSKKEFQVHCEWLKSKSEQLWLAPLGDVGDYLSARERFRIENLPSGDGEIRFALRAEPDGAPDPEHPLTVKLTWSGNIPVQAVQGGETLTVIRKEDGVLINVPKGNVPVILRKESL